MSCARKHGVIQNFGKTKDYSDEYVPDLYDCVVIGVESTFPRFNCFEFELARGRLHESSRSC